MKKSVSLIFAVMAIALTANVAQAQFVNQFDTVYFASATKIRATNTFTGNVSSDTVWTRLRYATNATMTGAVATSWQKDGNMASKTVSRVVTVSPGKYFFQLVTRVVTSDTAGNLVVVRQDTSNVMEAITDPVIVSATMTPLLDGFRLQSSVSSGNDSATKSITVAFDSLFSGSYTFPDSAKFNSPAFASADSSHGYSSAYYWVRLTVRNKIKAVSKTWMVVKPQAPKQAYVTVDSVPTTTTSIKVYLKVVTYGLKTKVFVSYGPTSAYGSMVMDSLPGKAGESYIVMTISGLTPDKTYHLGVIVKNSMPGSMSLPDFTATTDLYSQPFVLDLDSVKFSPSQNGLYVYYKGKVSSPSTSQIYLNLSKGPTFDTLYKSVGVQLTTSPVFVPGPFAVGTYYANLSGSDWLYGYSDQSDSVLVTIVSANGIHDITKPVEFSGVYRVYDTSGRDVGGGDVARGEIFSLKLRELAVPLGIYFYSVHPDNGQEAFAGKVVINR